VVRKQEILQETGLRAQVIDGVVKHLTQFMEPFLGSLGRFELKTNTHFIFAAKNF